MNYDIYLDLVEQEKYKEAIVYKNSCIPDVLYKYSWLDEETSEKSKEANELRLSTLAKGQIYLSALDQFNDPFEGKVFVFEGDDSLRSGFTVEQFQEFVDHINSHSRICCFSNADEKQQNMPMWAYYANNHRGFCVEYRLQPHQKNYIFPVSYDNSRVDGNKLLVNLISGIIQMVKEGKDSTEMPGEVSVHNQLAYLSLAYKHASWRHEKEYRALVPAVMGKYFDLEPHKIYVGMNCSKDHEKRLAEIAQSFSGCEIYKMQQTNNGLEFKLVELQLT